MNKHRSIAALLLLSLLLTATVHSATPSNTVSYLQSQAQNDAWVLMALRASGQYPSADALSIDGLTTATDIERTILGVVAGSGNPYQFKNTDLVARLDGLRQNAQIGDDQLLNDDIFGILAYRSAGYDASDNRVSESHTFVLNHQNGDGGWGYSIGTTSDSNITAMAVIALVKSGSSINDSAMTRAMDYLRTTQQSDGGFAIFSGQSSDTASTAWVISAIQTIGVDPNAWSNNGLDGFDFLQKTVQSDGSYVWKSGDSNGSAIMTAYAAVALAGTGYPVAVTTRQSVPAPTPVTPAPEPVPVQPVPIAPTPAPAPVAPLPPKPRPTPVAVAPHIRYRIEGAEKRLCQGEGQAATAMSALEIAEKACDFSVDATQSNWHYRVNWVQSATAANDYQLREGDYVTWYLGDANDLNLRVKIINQQDIGITTRVHVLVEHQVNGVFEPATASMVFLGGQRAVSDGNGVVVFVIKPGSYTLDAGKDGHIRTHLSTVTIK